MDKRLLLAWLCLIGTASADVCSPDLHLSGSSPDSRYTVEMNRLAPDGMKLLEHWRYVWRDTKTGERIEGELKELPGHLHSDVFLTDSRIAILEEASRWEKHHLWIFDRNGKFIRAFHSHDFCTFEEVMQVHPTVSHVGWIDQKVGPRLDGTILFFESTLGRTICVSLLLSAEDPRIAQRRKEREPRVFHPHQDSGLITINGYMDHEEIPARDDDFLMGRWMRDVRAHLEAVHENRAAPFGDDEVGQLYARSIQRDAELCGYLNRGRLTPAGSQLLVRKPAPAPPAPPAPPRTIYLARDESPLEQWPLLVLVVGGFAAVYLSARRG